MRRRVAGMAALCLLAGVGLGCAQSEEPSIAPGVVTDQNGRPVPPSAKDAPPPDDHFGGMRPGGVKAKR